VADAATLEQTRIVPAREEHIPFVAWVQLAAARSHLPRGTWDFYAGGNEEECLRYLQTLVATEAHHFAHYTNFLIAEVDGRPAASLSGYFEAEHGMGALAIGMEEANTKLGRSAEEHAAGWQRAGSIAHCMPEHPERAWIVEWVATAPEFRRRGLVDTLMAEILERGRQRGASVADIGVYIENDAAQRAYEKAGFEVVGEKRHPEFQAVYGSPGIRFLRRAI
jgi:ribosomal protein S18 acetylase RimI-like enzyme